MSALDTPIEIHTHPWYDQQHHAPDGSFRNVNTTARQGSFLKAAAWMTERAFRNKMNEPPPVRLQTADDLRTPPGTLRITWIGHTSLLIQTPDLTMLTDPVFGNRASPFSFAGPERLPDLPFPIEALPPIDAVLLSHDHYDHLDYPSVTAIHERLRPLFLAPLGVGRRLTDWGITRVVEFDWWQYARLDAWRIHCAPAQHFSGRTLFDRNSTLWASWYVEPLKTTNDDEDAGEDDQPHGRPSIYFAGDTAYNRHFLTVRERLGAPDVALIPIGAYLPRDFMRPVHMDPEEAAQAFQDVGALHFVPSHWGTFDLADEAVQDPAHRIRDLAHEHGFSDRLHLLDIGGQYQYNGSAASANTP